MLITGSGQQNRDEEIPEHKPFAVLADHLTRNGYIVLRVDDRGIGQTTGDLSSATTADFAADAVTSLQYLRGRKEVDTGKVGLIGHSEGAMIAQMIGAARSDIRFVVMLAGPGEKNDQLLLHQNRAILSKTGLSPSYINAYLELYRTILDSGMASSKATLKERISQVVNDWIIKTPDSIVVATTGIRDTTAKKNFVDAFARQIGTPWFQYFMRYDPVPNLKKITGNILALNGSEDIQVAAGTNLAGISAALKQGKSRSYSITEMKGLNHLFQQCDRCTVNEYGSLEQTIALDVLDTISNWIKTKLQ